MSEITNVKNDAESLSRKTKKTFYTVLFFVFLCFLGLAFAQFRIASEKRTNELSMLKSEKCQLSGFIQGNDVLSVNQYTYKCANGNAYTLNRKYELIRD